MASAHIRGESRSGGRSAPALPSWAMTLLLLALIVLLVGMVAALWLLLGGHRAAACGVLGGALGVAAAASAVAWAWNPEPRTNDAAVALWVVLALASAGALAAVRRPAWQSAALSLGFGACALLAGFGVYLVAVFRIF